MAAIDPDETPEFEDGDSSKPARATLKIIRPPPGLDLDESDDEDYSDEEDDEEDSDDEEVNGGPSDKERARKLKQAAAQKELEEAMEEDDEDDEEEDGGFDLKAAISKLIKGKAPATDDDDEDDESDEGLDLDENVICTLSPEQVSMLLIHIPRDKPNDCTEFPTASGHHRLRRRACLFQGHW